MRELHTTEIVDLCNAVKSDVSGGCTDNVTLQNAKAIVRHIVSWQRQTQCDVEIREAKPVE